MDMVILLNWENWIYDIDHTAYWKLGLQIRGTSFFFKLDNLYVESKPNNHLETLYQMQIVFFIDSWYF